MRGIQRVSTKGMSREEWLMRRRKTIGGSDAAGIVGLSRWASPFSVWADKTGRAAEKEDTEAMRQGRDLEDYVARRWIQPINADVKREMCMNVCLPNMAIPVEEQYLTNMPLFGLEKRNAAMLKIDGRLMMLISTKKHIYF